MKRTVLMGASLVVLVLIGAVTVMGGQMPMGSQGSEQEQSSGQSSMMGRGQMDPRRWLGCFSSEGIGHWQGFWSNTHKFLHKRNIYLLLTRGVYQTTAG
jgi:hypothetical protein